MSRTVRLAFCFDRGYVLPAAVSLHSLLSHARSPETVYELNVVAPDLDDAARALLTRVTAAFAQARLVFRTPPPLPPEVARAVDGRSHYSAALYYKLLLPALFPEDGRVAALDVDTVYTGDVAAVWDAPVEPGACLAGAREPLYYGWRGEGPLAGRARRVARYFRDYTPDERGRMRLNAGLIVYDLEAVRRAGAVARWLDFARANRRRLVLPEQDVFNLALDRPPSELPWDVCAYAPLTDDVPSVQLHYTTKVKPWDDPGCRRADAWFAALVSAGLVEDWRRFFVERLRGLYRERYAKTLVNLRAGRLNLKLLKYGRGR